MAQSPTTPRHSETTRTVASGLVVFAAVMLIIVGFLDVCRGIMGITEDEVFVETPNYVFKLDLTGWGWFHLILGLLALAVGVCLFKAPLWARIGGVIIAGVMIITSFLSMPYYPFWSFIVIALCAVSIWALCVVSPEDMTG
ncbi:hypothetical protein [Streptomyces sp. NPDC000410]|uniref:DUF7144 family membrane protein n=1 Tax=Streptomyces sp. NPDC000410 TaxID=3154254 RepID=UPI00331FA515